MQVGIDMVKISRMEKSMESEHFSMRVFTPEERALFGGQAARFQKAAGNFAGKEAFVKALGTGFGPLGFQDVAVLRNGRGAPYLALSPAAKELLGQREAAVSITNEGGFATAIVILSERGER